MKYYNIEVAPTEINMYSSIIYLSFDKEVNRDEIIRTAIAKNMLSEGDVWHIVGVNELTPIEFFRAMGGNHGS